MDVGGGPARRKQVPYARCPSSREEDPWGDFEWASANYCGSLGSQRTPSNDGNCNTWFRPNPNPTTGVYDGNYENPGGSADHGNTTSPSTLSGMIGRLGPVLSFSDVRDGTSNVFFVGEILPNCSDHAGGWWYYNAMGNAHASTSVPLNTKVTCNPPPDPTHPCRAQNNWNYSWGFRSNHSGGANFLLVDASVQFVTDTVDYQTYQMLGGRRDGRAIKVAGF